MKKKKVLSLFLALLMVMSILQPGIGSAVSFASKDVADDTVKDVAEETIDLFNTASADDYILSTSSVLTELTTDEAYISSFSVVSISDGTAPFDGNSNPGNDANDSNKICRTFDDITYMVKTEMAIYDKVSTTAYSEARVKMEFVLPVTSDEAVFNTGAMAWMDRTPEYMWKITNETRTIDGVAKECQVLTCYKHLLPSETSDSVVPGDFTENVTISVKSMKNGETLQPVYSAAMEHNTWNGSCSKSGHGVEKKTTTPDPVTISAAPKYNISMERQPTQEIKGTFDFNTGYETGNFPAANYGIGTVYGLRESYGIRFELRNDNVSKGFKGIELPTGDITFEIQLDNYYTLENGTKFTTLKEDGYTPLLWSYGGNGQLNRDGRKNNTYDLALSGIPKNNYYSNGTGCYDGGEWHMTQVDDRIYVTIKNYAIDLDMVPVYGGYIGDRVMFGEDKAIAVISTAAFNVIQPLSRVNSRNTSAPYDMGQQYGNGGTVSVTLTDMNLKATTVSGQVLQDPAGTSNAQTRTSDDRVPFTRVLLKPGEFNTRLWYTHKDSTGNNWDVNQSTEHFYSGTDVVCIGQQIRGTTTLDYSANEVDNIALIGLILYKFDGAALVPNGSNHNTKSTITESTYYYATKPDGSNWSSLEEQQAAREDDLVYYKSIAEVPAGHTIVAVLVSDKLLNNGNTITKYYINTIGFDVKTDRSLLNTTHSIVQSSHLWTVSQLAQAGLTQDEVYSIDWSDGNNSINDLPSTSFKIARNYIPETYAADGSGPLGTHTGTYYYGDTLLVVGYKAGITKNLEQSVSGNEKQTYNLDAEQRVVDFVMQPTLKFDYAVINGMTTKVTVVDTLPKYLKYVPNSSYYGGFYTQTSALGGTQGRISGGTAKEPTVVNNADGTQTLTWVFNNVNVDEEMEKIHYSAYIGVKGDEDNDVPIGTTDLVNKVRIYATDDTRAPSFSNGNYAESGLAVAKGQASSFYKRVLTPFFENGGIIRYEIKFSNNGNSRIPVKLFDNMPYNGDANGSNFDGTYTVTSWKLQTSDNSNGNFSLYYTTDTAYRGVDTQNITDDEIYAFATRGTINADGTSTSMNGKTPSIWGIGGSLEPNQSVTVTLEITPVLNTVDNNTKLVNSCSSSEMTTNTPPTIPVVRKLSGSTWMDTNKDGLRNNGEEKFSGVKVTLYKLRDGGNPINPVDYLPCTITVDGNKVPVTVETGYAMNVATGEKTAIENGNYSFDNLPEGTFLVIFEDGSTPISNYVATTVGTSDANDDIDSDATPVYGLNDVIDMTYIMGIVMPSAAEMGTGSYSSEFNDSGFYTMKINPDVVVVDYGKTITIDPLANDIGNFVINGLTLSAPAAGVTTSQSIKTANGIAAVQAGEKDESVSVPVGEDVVRPFESLGITVYVYPTNNRESVYEDTTLLRYALAPNGKITKYAANSTNGTQICASLADGSHVIDGEYAFANIGGTIHVLKNYELESKSVERDVERTYYAKGKNVSVSKDISSTSNSNRTTVATLQDGTVISAYRASTFLSSRKTIYIYAGSTLVLTLGTSGSTTTSGTFSHNFTNFKDINGNVISLVISVSRSDTTSSTITATAQQLDEKKTTDKVTEIVDVIKMTNKTGNETVTFTLFKYLSNIEKFYYCVSPASAPAKNSDSADLLYSTISVIPATTVYYEDNFGGSEEDGGLYIKYTGAWMSVDDNGNKTQMSANTDINDRQDRGEIGQGHVPYGYDSSYADCTKFSNGSAAVVQGTISKDENGKNQFDATAAFTFTGTGFDIISRTDMDCGQITVAVYDVNGNLTANVPVINKGVQNLYQIPVISYTGLNYGTYNVKINVNAPSKFLGITGSTFYLDAIRIYDPMGLSASDNAEFTEANNAYLKDKEANAFVGSIRDYILSIGDLGVDEESGAVYVDTINNDYTGGGVLQQDKLEDFQLTGPNEEVYLTPGKGVGFALVTSAVPSSVQLEIKIPAPLSNSANLLVQTNGKIGSRREISVSSAAEMFYDITDAVQFVQIQKDGATYYRAVVILSNGLTGVENDIISITNVKLTYPESATNIVETNDEDTVATAGETSTVIDENGEIIEAPTKVAVGVMASWNIYCDTFDTIYTQHKASVPTYNVATDINDMIVTAQGKKVTATFTTSQFVDDLVITDADGKKVNAEISSVIDEDNLYTASYESAKVWTVTFDNAAGLYNLTVAAANGEGETAEITVNVKPVEAVSISVLKTPVKTQYKLGETIDPNGLELLVTYSDGTTKVVKSGYTLSTYKADKSGRRSVTVSYNGLQTSFKINVKSNVAQIILTIFGLGWLFKK